jgi:hypothetical protein
VRFMLLEVRATLAAAPQEEIGKRCWPSLNGMAKP